MTYFEIEMNLNQGACEGRVGNMANEAGCSQSITKPWKMNTEAEIGSKEAKQYWEEHDTKMSDRRQQGHPRD